MGEGVKAVKLSLCMIVRDEEATLPGCLHSVRDVVDEMVIVDTGSHDRTPEIAQSLGAIVHSFPWIDDFSAARNASLQYAQGDWILVLDADEVLVPDCVPALQQTMQAETVLVANLLREEVGATQAPYSLISRLFRNRPDIRFSRPYHELVDDSVLTLLNREPHWQVVELPGVAIRHTGYQPDVIAQRQKYDRARTTMERFLISHPDDSYLCNKLGALYLSTGEAAKAIQLLERGLQATDEAPVLYELHYHLGDAYTQLGNPAQAQHHYTIALNQRISPHVKLAAYTSWGNLLMQQGDVKAANQLYQRVVDLAPEFAIGHYNLGVSLKALGQVPSAIAHYQQAIHLNPDYPEAHQNLGVILWNSGKILESLACFRQAIALYDQQGSSEAMRLRQGLQQRGFNL